MCIVLLRDAKIPGVFDFPMMDDRTSMMPYVLGNMSIHRSAGELIFDHIHEHPLIFSEQDPIHDDDNDDNDDNRSHLCNACVQPISPPFYRCSKCIDFVLHSCCANLKHTIDNSIMLQQFRSNLTLFPRVKSHDGDVSWFSIAGEFSFSTFRCGFCYHKSSGFAYGCQISGFTMDVVCASLPFSITHRLHGKSHILRYLVERDDFLSSRSQDPCSCCNFNLGHWYYFCINCPHFRLHTWCAQLPLTVNHRFDKHPLRLTTEYCEDCQQFCEICEETIGERCWYYSCRECEQSFHTSCFTSLGDISKIKLGVPVRVKCHDCPVKLVRAFAVDGCICGYCKSNIDNPSGLAFECSECGFTIHEHCAEECLIKDEKAESLKITFSV